MRGGVMTDLKKYSNLKYYDTLKNTSKDDRNRQQIQYMTEATNEVIDFDEVKNQYVSTYGLLGEVKSNDALFNDTNGNIVFVEFKNGFLDDRTVFGVKNKIYDSILVLLDILSLKIADFRQQEHYILVYNADANMENKNLLDNHDYANKAKDNIVPDYKELEPLTVPLFKLSGMKMVKFGVNMFKKYCFNEVYTFSKEEFQEYVAKNL
jgi:hypothetical protein